MYHDNAAAVVMRSWHANISRALEIFNDTRVRGILTSFENEVVSTFGERLARIDGFSGQVALDLMRSLHSEVRIFTCDLAKARMKDKVPPGSDFAHVRSLLKTHFGVS
ncbi:MAG: hypothetical protein ABIH41_05610 [Nanoarchaeota archaeon]